jgi:hypothetical protein
MDLSWLCLNWREGALRYEYSALRAGIFKALGSSDPMRIWEAAEEARSCAAYHRLDEPARLSLSMVASLQRPLPFPLTEDYNFAPITSLPLTRRYVLFFNEDAMNRLPRTAFFQRPCDHLFSARFSAPHNYHGDGNQVLKFSFRPRLRRSRLNSGAC